MWTAFQLILIVTLVVTGSINTLAAKWAYELKSEDSSGKETSFEHPYLQSSFMFLGEILCLFAFYFLIFRNNRQPVEIPGDKEKLSGEDEPAQLHYTSFIMLPPAFCDFTASSVMNIGLILTSASSYQMLRGSNLIFVGILTVLVLKRRLEWFRWFGMFILLIGLIVVGVSDFLLSEETASDSGTSGDTNITSVNGTNGTGGNPDDEEGTANEIIGDVLVVAAQLVVAVQAIYEEKFIKKYNIPPLKVVGFEGVFGLLITILFVIIFYFIKVDDQWGQGPDNRLEDAIDGFIQIGNNYQLIISIILSIISIAFFNFAGISITKELSATTRNVLDQLRTMVIWAFSLAFGWQKFHYLQPVGFVLMVTGIFVYNDILIRPFIQKKILKNKD